MEPACAWKRTARAATEALVVAVALAAALAAAAFARAAPSTQPLKALHHDCRDSFTNKFNGNHFVDDSPCCASLHLAPGCAHKAKPRPGKEPDGLDWKMPSRLQSEVRTWTASRGLPPLDEVNPSKWHVNLFLTRNKKALSSCPSGGKWEWAVKAPKGAKVVGKPKAGCTTSMDVSALGTYHVTATNSKTHKPIPGAVVVKDWLLVGLGDSNGSGEGNPPFEFVQCNRSVVSYQFKTAQYVESHDPRSSVTFVMPSCSGAIIEDIYKTSYVGVHPGPPLEPQIEQAARVIEQPLDPPSAQRHVDGAIVSAGVNNLGFGPLLAFCATNLSPSDPCQDRLVVPVFNSSGGIDDFQTSSAPEAAPLKTQIDSLIAQLPGRYKALAGALSAPLDSGGSGKLGVKPDHVVITQYPDFTRGSDGQLCDGTIGSPTTWGFVELAAAGLNAQVARAAGANGWKGVTMPQSDFTGPPTGHGYCASDPYFVTLSSAVIDNRDHHGGFHPNSTGHTITANATQPVLCRALYGNPKCDGKPR
jgi:hypothetical protein